MQTTPKPIINHDKLKLDILYALAELGDATALSEARQLRPTGPVRKAELAYEIRHQDHAAMLPRIKTALQDGDQEVVLEALRAVRPEDDLLPEVIEVLTGRHAESDSYHGRDLRKLAAAYIASKRPAEEDVQSLLLALTDTRRSQDARIAAIQALRYKHRMVSVVEACLTVLAESPAVVRTDLCRAIQDVLAIITNQEMVHRKIVEAIHQDQPCLHGLLAALVDRLRADDLQLLDHFIDDPDGYLVAIALRGIVQLNAKGEIAHLRQRLKSCDIHLMDDDELESRIFVVSGEMTCTAAVEVTATTEEDAMDAAGRGDYRIADVTDPRDFQPREIVE